MYKIFLLILQCGLFTCIGCVCFSQEETTLLSMNEAWTEKVPVSGEIKVGLVESFDDSNIKPDSFQVYLPNTTEKILCVHISTRNGKFSAELQFDISKHQKNKWTKFPLKSNYINELRSFKSEEIVILSKLSNNCIEEGVGFLISKWGSNDKSDITNENVNLVVNTEHKPQIKVNGKKCVECMIEKIRSIDIVNYNQYCVIPKSVLTKDVNNVKIIITELILGEKTIVSYPLVILK